MSSRSARDEAAMKLRNQVLLTAVLHWRFVEHSETMISPMPGFIIFDKGPSERASGAIFR